ncbi:MAG: heme-binding domain-containing protein [Candidatus Marinimicrobia bacterium]|nr:heme-binding domain-containing protein [Candidatus Neomarinimicrobiota bacterium]MCF7839936.1 heme-binding domain-containing protein [Candidatus Neomarinimicrobiota bacterium]
MKSLTSRIILILIVLFVLIQFFPVNRTNPPVETEIEAPEEVHAILDRACYDCHSNNSQWPWYAYVAPVSWLVAKDVNQGREHVNFSTWNLYDFDDRADIYDEIYEVIDEGEMPLAIYVPLHPEAKLSEEDKQLLMNWAVEANAQLFNQGDTSSDDAPTEHD